MNNVLFTPPNPNDQPGFFWAHDRIEKIKRLCEPEALSHCVFRLRCALNVCSHDSDGPDYGELIGVLADAITTGYQLDYYEGHLYGGGTVGIGVETDEQAASVDRLNTAINTDQFLANTCRELFYGIPTFKADWIVRIKVPRPFCHGSEIWHYIGQPNIHRCPVCLNSRQSTKFDRGENYAPNYRRTPSNSKRKRVMDRYRECALCESRDNLEMGHCISVADGRSKAVNPDLLNADENYAPMCRACNAKQGARSLTPEQYLELAVPQTVIAVYQALKDIHGTA